MVNILHFSRTPLAGAPIRIVQALQKYTNLNVHLVDLNHWNYYDKDIIFSEEPEFATELAEDADIIHLHNYLDYNSKDFYPIDFQKLSDEGVIFIRQFHSHPTLVAQEMHISVNELLNSPIPSLVIAQYQERYYPKARVVPNIIPQNDRQYTPSEDDPSEFIVFSPSKDDSIFTDRWNTKSVHETMKSLKMISNKTGYPIRKITGKPLSQVLNMKRRARIVVDELVTGSYHLSGLEGLSLGKPVFSYLDSRVDYVLREISGAKTSPFLNIRLEDSFEVIKDLLIHPDILFEIGRDNRKWIEQYWADRELIRHYKDIYNKLLSNSTMISRQESLTLSNPAIRYKSIDIPDLIYSNRLKRYYGSFNFARYKIKRKAVWAGNQIISRFRNIRHV